MAAQRDVVVGDIVEIMTTPPQRYEVGSIDREQDVPRINLNIYIVGDTDE